MNMIGERLIYKLKGELDYILDSCAGVKKDDDKAREKMVKCILHKKGRLREDITSVKDSIAYKLAEILKSEPKTWPEFRELVGTFIPAYRANPRKLTEYGGFSWRTKFAIPPKQSYKARRVQREKKAEKLSQNVIKNFDDEMEEFKKFLFEQKIQIDDLSDRVERIEKALKSIPVLALTPLL